ncbi:hypothetical protein SAMN05660826_00322 [Caldanaerovirga acetigignens]|uniref:Uncharacterized protein n=1 Tax=Caldanaerovirga acetigignens TaxID=447595 RepID=A0A1M7GGG7_9FIRM|nr:hypothetical protein [Caldanaerovirga acetigignens]SHM15311.1 hypothetical protein SAMN05660826_00322 [Caldanaerovirga acetigignens]
MSESNASEILKALFELLLSHVEEGVHTLPVKVGGRVMGAVERKSWIFSWNTLGRET